MANYDGVLTALGANLDPSKNKSLRLGGKHAAAAALSERRMIANNTTVKGGQDEETRRDPYMSVFRKAPLPFVGLKNDPRKTRMWVVDREHQQLGGEETESDPVLQHVPQGVLSALSSSIAMEEEEAPQPKHPPRRMLGLSPAQRAIAPPTSPPPAPQTSTALVRPEDLRNDWLAKRRRLKTRKRLPIPELTQLGTIKDGTPHDVCLNPRSEAPVRIKNRATPSVLMSQDIDTIISQYDSFGSKFQSLSTKDQDTWRVLWQANNPHLRASLEKYCKAGLFPENVRSKRYNDLFQQGIFITPHNHLQRPPSPKVANLI